MSAFKIFSQKYYCTQKFGGYYFISWQYCHRFCSLFSFIL